MAIAGAATLAGKESLAWRGRGAARATGQPGIAEHDRDTQTP